jgi:hypothetical protein
MNPQYRKPVILFLASFILIGGGMAYKVMHWPGAGYAGTLFGAGMLVQMFSVMWLIVVIMKPRKKQE